MIAEVIDVCESTQEKLGWMHSLFVFGLSVRSWLYVLLCSLLCIFRFLKIFSFAQLSAFFLFLKMALWKGVKSKPAAKRPQSRYEVMRDMIISRELISKLKQYITDRLSSCIVAGIYFVVGMCGSHLIPKLLVGLLGVNFVIGAVLCWVFIECIAHFHRRRHHQSIFIDHLKRFDRGLVLGMLLQVYKHSSKWATSSLLVWIIPF